MTSSHHGPYDQGYTRATMAHTKCTLEHWYAEQGCNFCGWQLYERGELVDVLWGELEWSSPTDDDELPEVTGPAWIVDNVAHYGG